MPLDERITYLEPSPAVEPEVVVPEPPSFWLLFPGVLLPAATVAIEAVSHMCAESFFDPIPTPAHLVLAFAVPLLNLYVWWRLRTGLPEPRSLAWMLGAAAGVGLVYALLFLPFVPIALFAVLIGIGLLPLAPLLSLLATFHLLMKLRAWSLDSGRLFRYGLASGWLLLLLLEVPGLVTEYGLSLAASERESEQQRGLNLLRVAGNQDYILNRCYWQSGRARLFGWLPGFESVNPTEARKVYYRLTGGTFDSVLASRASAWARRTFDWDPDVGGTSVGQRLKGLSLGESRVDGTVDAIAGIGYLEWTMVFRNVNDSANEARAQLQLPPGAVVSRVTLWVNGEEREAAFGERDQVRQAYQKVVRVRRDPLLVTTSGPERVLVQCFPVPAHGEMKIRLGLTTPLYQRTKLLLPTMVERNFRLAEGQRHSVWIESKRGLKAMGLQESADGSVFRLRGQTEAFPVVEMDAGLPQQVWTPDERQGGWIAGREVNVAGTRPRSVAVVVDGSAGLARYRDEIARALRGINARVFVASDQLVRAEADLSGVEFRGGVDSVPALMAAFGSEPDAVVWVHGRQPETFLAPNVLLQYRQRGGKPLYALAALDGPNRVAEALDGLAVHVPRTGSLQQDLERLFREWDGGWRWEFERHEIAPADAVRTSSHLARLWAAAEVRRLIAGNEMAGAGRVASQYQLVTPVSGAVVLEDQQQYKENQLQPADRMHVPTVPEPETWLLMAIVAAVLVFVSKRRMLWSRRSA